MDDFERVAREVVTEAGEIMFRAWGEAKTIEYKGTLDLVTATDREVEAFVVDRLRHAFPDHIFVAEEASAGTGPERPPADTYAWYLDPIDGTTNFAHSYPQFALSLGLARGDELQLAFVYEPTPPGDVCGAPRRGATLNDKPIDVSAVDDIGQALLGTGFPYDRREHIDFYLGFVATSSAARKASGAPARVARSVLHRLWPARRLLGVETLAVGYLRRQPDRTRSGRHGHRLQRRTVRSFRAADARIERPHPSGHDRCAARPAGAGAAGVVSG